MCDFAEGRGFRFFGVVAIIAASWALVVLVVAVDAQHVERIFQALCCLALAILVAAPTLDNAIVALGPVMAVKAPVGDVEVGRVVEGRGLGRAMGLAYGDCRGGRTEGMTFGAFHRPLTLLLMAVDALVVVGGSSVDDAWLARMFFILMAGTTRLQKLEVLVGMVAVSAERRGLNVAGVVEGNWAEELPNPAHFQVGRSFLGEVTVLATQGAGPSFAFPFEAFGQGSSLRSLARCLGC